MRAQFVIETLNEYNFFKRKAKVDKDILGQEVANTVWAHNFKNEEVIEIIKYKNVPIKLIKMGKDPEKYYAILPVKYFTITKLMPYYSLKSAINSTKNYIDAYMYSK